MTKLKNTNCEKTQKLKLLPNSKTQMLTKLSSDSCDSSDSSDSSDNSDIFFVLKIVAKLKNSNCDKIKKK